MKTAHTTTDLVGFLALAVHVVHVGCWTTDIRDDPIKIRLAGHLPDLVEHRPLRARDHILALVSGECTERAPTRAPTIDRDGATNALQGGDLGAISSDALGWCMAAHEPHRAPGWSEAQRGAAERCIVPRAPEPRDGHNGGWPVGRIQPSLQRKPVGHCGSPRATAASKRLWWLFFSTKSVEHAGDVTAFFDRQPGFKAASNLNHLVLSHSVNQ